jgi:integrase
LHEPFSTLALLSVCLGLRISEALALRWCDIDWLGSTLSIRRAIVERHVDVPKTENSAETMTLSRELLFRLQLWRQLTQFPAEQDWLFASPSKIGRLPYSYTGVWRELQRAAEAAGIGRLGTHSFRHTYRSWLDQVGTQLAVQQKAMRHTDIRTTMIYGDVVDGRIGQALEKVSGLVFASSTRGRLTS